MTGQRQAFPPDDLSVQRIESGVRELCGAIELVWREGSGDVVDELLGWVFTHPQAT